MSDPSPRDETDAPWAEEPAAGPFFRLSDWIAFAVCTVVALIGYIATLAPSVTLEDAGEMVVAADYLGVPHPPGYPIWTLLAWFFQWIFHAKEFHGHPNPAWAVGLTSAVFGALACGLMAMLVSRSSTDLLRGIQRFSAAMSDRAERTICAVCGISAGLVLAFSPVMWSQSVIVEVYSLNAFFQVSVMLLFYRWLSRPGERGYLYAMAFLFGLGLTNHQTLLLFALALALGLLLRDPDLFRDFLLVGGGIVALVLVHVAFVKLEMQAFAWTAPDGPWGPAFWVYLILAVAIPAAGWFLLPNGRTVAITILLAELGVSFYLYLPLASEQNPPMNWGYARTWEGFLHAVTRGQYEKISPTDIFTMKFIQQIGVYLADLRRQFTLPLVVCGILPFTMWEITIAGRRVRMFSIAFLFALIVGGLIALETLLAMGGVAPPAPLVALYRMIAAVALLIGGVGVMGETVRMIGRVVDSTASRVWGTAAAYVFVLAMMVLALIFYEFQLIRLLAGGARLGPEGALFVLFLMIAPPALGVALHLLRRPPFRFAFEPRAASQAWLLTSVAGFFSVSVVFIILWNPALDIQTMFIGRVQFIQSHVLYALWMGYGFVLGLAMLELLIGWLRALRWAVVAAALVAPPGLMFLQNAYDEELLHMFGGAEQNGHDFGWQFGDWQLRGAEGIREYLENTLSPPEFEAAWAAYPDPTYPPPMEPDAIFFGGTDPGRFVPTYMIYSAKIRPDVYLITQNALADNTYLNVMRDLYGDTIWIPSVADSNVAFQQYFDQIQSGEIDAGADVAVREGRISVQGVAGVMQINGILARQIFDNNPAHALYVEESYVIPWMYEFLEPHGLILKIARNPSVITPELIARDRAFWDWYSARLLADRRFLRDVVARKSFSKLRGAIAGLYAARGHPAEAEYAFRQAVALYPLSPEANFRLADVYVNQARFAEAKSIISDFLDGDPRNDKVRQYLGIIEQIETGVNRIAELERQIQNDRMEIGAALELVDLYRSLGRWKQFDAMLKSLLDNENLPASAYLRLGNVAYETRRFPLLELALIRYTAQQPNDVAGWIELSGVRLALGRTDDAMAVLANAVRVGGPGTRERILADERFAQLRNRQDFRQLLTPPPAPSPGPLPDSLQRLIR